MKKVWYVVFSLLIVSAFIDRLIAADSAVRQQNDTEISNTIRRLMEELNRTANETLDAEKTLASLTKDKDAVFFFDSKPYRREELIDCLRKLYGSLSTISMKMSQIRVKVLGPDAAVWIACGKGQAVGKSGESSEEFLTETWIWQRIEGRWQVVHYHESVTRLPNAMKRAKIEKALTQFTAKLQKAQLTAEGISAAIEKFLSGNPEIVGSAYATNPVRGPKAAYYVYRDQAGFARRGTPTNYDYSEADWYAKSAKTGKAEWSEPYYDMDGARIYMMTCSVPVYSRGKELLGVITADLGI